MTLLENLDASGLPIKRVAVIQGEVHTSADPQVELTTVLGSCVATCLYDPVARIGGMNHFLLAEPPEHQRAAGGFDEHYGLYLMELLINRMLHGGAVKSRLKARLFGGANFYHTVQQIGAINAEFARRFLQQEGIELSAADMGGTCARRVHFRPTTGQVRCKITEAQTIATTNPTRRPPSAHGDVELF